MGKQAARYLLAGEWLETEEVRELVKSETEELPPSKTHLACTDFHSKRNGLIKNPRKRFAADLKQAPIKRVTGAHHPGLPSLAVW